MAGAEEETKRKAFRRAADSLIESSTVGMGSGRVWVVQKTGLERDIISRDDLSRTEN